MNATVAHCRTRAEVVDCVTKDDARQKANNKLMRLRFSVLKDVLGGRRDPDRDAIPGHLAAQHHHINGLTRLNAQRSPTPTYG